MDVDDATRARWADEWKARYGEPIDHAELRRVASPDHLRELRADLAARRLANDLSRLLERQARERWRLIRSRRVRGTSSRLRDALPPQPEGRWSVPGGAPAAVHLHMLLFAMDGNVRRDRRALARIAGDLSPWPPSTGSRSAPDYPMGYVCEQVAAWIRERRSDGRTSWRDVVECLRFYGHDLRAWSQPEASAKRAATRWRAATRGT